jgi:hypothetical protein
MTDEELNNILTSMTEKLSSTMDRFGKTLERNFDDLGKGLAGAKDGYTDTRKKINSFGDGLDDAKEKAKYLKQELEQFSKKYNKNLSESSFNLDRLTDRFKSGKIKIDDFSSGVNSIRSELKQYEDAIEDLEASRATASAEELAVIDEQLNALKSVAAENKKSGAIQQLHNAEVKLATNLYKQANIEFAKNVAGIAFRGLASAAGGAVKSLQGGASGIDVAAGIMGAGIDAAGDAAKTAGAAVGGLGGALASSTNPYVKTLGVIASVAGPAIAGIGESASKMAKFGLEVVQKELEKTITAFNTMSKSGALFADGMTGMRNAAGNAGLTVDSFSKVVSERSAELGAAGIGVTEATKRMGGVAKSFSETVGASGQSVQMELRNLGYSLEEQAGLIAETMADLNRRGTARGMTDQQIASATAQYAQDLRTLSAITGEDAKSKMAAAKAAANQIAFQNKLAEMDPTVAAELERSMMTMTAQQKKDFMEMQLFGTVVNETGAIMMASNRGYANSMQQFNDAANEGALTVEKASDIQAENSQLALEDRKNLTAIGMAQAANGSFTEVANAGLDAMQNFQKFTTESVAAAKAATEGQKNTQDALTNSVQGSAKAADELRVAIQEKLTGAITKFAEYSEKILKSLDKTIKESSGEESGLNWMGGASGALSGAGTGAAIGALGGPIGIAIGGAIGAAIGGGIGLMSGKANGGIASGPESGYMEKLHGMEAVVPLPDNKTIPVNITQAPATITNDNSELVGLLKDLIAKTSAGHEKFDDMVKTLKDGVAVNNDILQSMS